MAGTRLLLQCSFISQILLVVALAFYFGLSDDLVARNLLGSRDARWLLADPQLSLSDLKLTIPPVTFICADSQVGFWNNYLKEFQQPTDRIQVKAHPELQSVCRDPSTRLSVANADVWICESVPPPIETRVVISNSSTILYSRGLKHRKEDLEHVYPRDEHVTQQDLQITVHVPSHGDIAIWRTAARKWLQDSRIGDWPCVGDIRLRVLRFDLSTLAAEISNPIRNRDGDGEEDETPITYQVSPTKLSAFIANSGMTDDSIVYLSLLVPSQFPVVFDDRGSRLVKRRHHSLAVLSEAPADDTHVALINKALGAAMETVVTQCMGMPSDLIDFVQLQTLDHSFPSLYTKLWFQRQLSSRLKEVIDFAQQQRDDIFTASPTVHVSHEIASRWLDAVGLIRSSLSLASGGDYLNALDALDTAYETLLSIRSDPGLLEPHDFPMDQYSAIFAPLLFPLLLPLLVGLRREYKRYREHMDDKQKKKQD